MSCIGVILADGCKLRMVSDYMGSVVRARCAGLRWTSVYWGK